MTDIKIEHELYQLERDREFTEEAVREAAANMSKEDYDKIHELMINDKKDSGVGLRPMNYYPYYQLLGIIFEKAIREYQMNVAELLAYNDESIGE